MLHFCISYETKQPENSNKYTQESIHNFHFLFWVSLSSPIINSFTLVSCPIACWDLIGATLVVEDTNWKPFYIVPDVDVSAEERVENYLVRADTSETAISDFAQSFRMVTIYSE